MCLLGGILEPQRIMGSKLKHTAIFESSPAPHVLPVAPQHDSCGHLPLSHCSDPGPVSSCLVLCGGSPPCHCHCSDPCGCSLLPPLLRSRVKVSCLAPHCVSSAPALMSPAYPFHMCSTGNIQNTKCTVPPLKLLLGLSRLQEQRVAFQDLGELQLPASPWS